MRDRRHRQQAITDSSQMIERRFPPSEPCACEVCLQYCQRPGWWSVQEAARAIEAGLAGRMMLEMSPDLTFGVLSPAFPGCEESFVNYGLRGCTFLHHNHCQLFGTGLQPLECRYCHHNRRGQGKQCHAALEADWHTAAGIGLVVRWSRLTHFWDRYQKYPNLLLGPHTRAN